MPIYEYQGQHYDIEDSDPIKAKEKILKHLNIQQEPIVEFAKPTASDAFESNLLSPLMAMSRGFGSLTKGGVSEDALSSAVNTAEKGMEEHPIAGTVGKLAGLIGPSVPVLGAMPVLAPAAGLGGMGAGIVGGAAAAPTVGVGTGVERYQSLLNKGIPEDEAKKAGISEGVINAASNMIPTRGGLIARALQGAGINAATGAGNRAIQNELITDPVGHQNVFDPKAMALDMAIGGLTEGAFGSRSHEKLLAKNEPAGVVHSAQQRLNTGTGSNISDIELRLLQDNYHMLSKRRLNLDEELKIFNKLIEDGLASEQVINHAKGIEGEIKSVDSTIDKLDKIFSDPKQF